MSVQQIAPQGQKPSPRRFPWLFRVAFGTILAITLALIGVTIWLVRTLGTDQLYTRLGIIASIIAILSNPLILLFTITKWPGRKEEHPSSPPQPQPIIVQLVPPVPASPPLPLPEVRATATSHIWNVPYPRNPFFTGREDLLKQLRDHLVQSTTAALTQPPAITGLGGIGKTQIAVEYAYRYRAEYHSILWINTASRETLVEGFVTLARLLALPEKDEKDQDVVVEATKQWIAMHDYWLLILDNADDLALASAFLPVTQHGHILLTTRASATGSIAASFPVETMDETEGILFLLRRAKVLKTADTSLSQVSEAVRETARIIVKEMGGLPLALDQAGAYIEETHNTLEGYLKEYRQRSMELLRERGEDRRSHPDPVATTWSLNFAHVEQNSPLAADVLRFLAFLAPDAIPEALIIAGASELGATLQTLKEDETRFNKPVKLLSSFSLVQRTPDMQILTIHRLVQAIIQANMTDDMRREWAERTVRAVNQAFPDVTDYHNWSRGQQYLPHAQACATWINEWQLTFPEAGSLLNKIAYYLDDHAQYTEAEPLYQRALQIIEQVLGREHPSTITIQANYQAFLEQMKSKRTRGRSRQQN
jgi:hypothetical protein